MIKCSLVAIILTIIICGNANAQALSVTDATYILQDDNIKVEQGFELLDRLAKGTLKDRLFIHQGKMYFRFAISLHKVRRTYLIEGNKMRKVTDKKLKL